MECYPRMIPKGHSRSAELSVEGRAVAKLGFPPQNVTSSLMVFWKVSFLEKPSWLTVINVGRRNQLLPPHKGQRRMGKLY